MGVEHSKPIAVIRALLKRFASDSFGTFFLAGITSLHSSGTPPLCATLRHATSRISFQTRMLMGNAFPSNILTATLFYFFLNLRLGLASGHPRPSPHSGTLISHAAIMSPKTCPIPMHDQGIFWLIFFYLSVVSLLGRYFFY